MKTLVFALFAILVSNASLAATHSVKGYTKKNGTYVASHRKTTADHSKANNWSTKGNTNPYTGKKGTKSLNSISTKSKR